MWKTSNYSFSARHPSNTTPGIGRMFLYFVFWINHIFLWMQRMNFFNSSVSEKQASQSYRILNKNFLKNHIKDNILEWVSSFMFELVPRMHYAIGFLVFDQIRVFYKRLICFGSSLIFLSTKFKKNNSGCPWYWNAKNNIDEDMQTFDQMR